MKTFKELQDYLLETEWTHRDMVASVSNSIDHVIDDIITALALGDDAEVGRIIRAVTEDVLSDEANAIEEADPDWRDEARTRRC